MPRYATPLRYPGGKQRLAPFIQEILEANDAVGWNYVEPYCGGAGVALELLLRDQVDHVYLNDSSEHIYAFWRTLLRDPDDFCSRISRASLTLDAWRRHREVVRHPRDHPMAEVGFSTFFLNRCNRSGVLTAGVIGGLSQKGIWRVGARFPRNELIRRIEAIAKRKRQITISNEDAEQCMLRLDKQLPRESLVYCDPPYMERAERLYLNTYADADHTRLSRTIQSKLRLPWIVSYNAHAKVTRLYAERRFFRYSLQYSAMSSYEGKEVFIFADRLRIPSRSKLAYVSRGLASLRIA